MATEAPSLNRAVIFGSAVIYWAGVWLQARRVRRQTGRSQNTRPRGFKEKLLWAGWAFVVVAWLALPFLSQAGRRLPWAVILQSLVRPIGLPLGILMMGAGYAGTLWCYVALGNAWRMGVNRTEKTVLVTHGPYRFVRHPIYLCQIIMVAAITLLLPSALSLLILAVHLVCALIKAADEESHLRRQLGRSYEVYQARTGGWFPRLFRRRAQTATEARDAAGSTKPGEITHQNSRAD